MIDPLVRQHRLERLRLGVHPRPHEVVVPVGGVDLVEAVGVADLADQFGVGVDGLEAEAELGAGAGGGRSGHVARVEHHHGDLKRTAII